MSSNIEWTDETWNPVTGCSKISAGCANCYAEAMDKRFDGYGKGHKPWTAANAEHNVVCHENRLTNPMHWKKPRMVFVDSMSDLFHEQVPFEFIDKVFAVMMACAILTNRHHTFQVLTKRPERMVEYFDSRTPEQHLKTWANEGDCLVYMDDEDTVFSEYVYGAVCRKWSPEGTALSEHKPWGFCENLYPLPNVWLGVSVENQQAADERIPLLLKTPAAVRFLSCEPLLGPVDFETLPCPNGCKAPDYCGTCDHESPGRVAFDLQGIDWVIVGGESGRNVRPMHPDWARSIRDQCQAAEVPFFFKQWGQWAPLFEQPWEKRPAGNCRIVNHEGGHGFHGKGAMWVKSVGKGKAGRLLDGQVWNEMPS